jgi:DNA repair protein SbcD/Mre11
MPRFLHVADIHLGFERYDNPRRTQDFYYAFNDALQRFAIDEAVDFVVIAGDLFEHRVIQPATLNQAQLCLGMLQDAGIPVIAIEGNHDNRPYGTKTSWLRYLASWGLLILLEPGSTGDGDSFYAPWDPEEKKGGYIDLPCGVRVLGSSWYGATAPKAIAQIAESIQELPPARHSVLLFHHGLEGQIARYQGALRYADLLPLKKARVDYLALGHIHKSYAVDNWVFNPGSIEANNIEEGQYDRGAYLVTIDGNGIQAELKQDYYQRPMLRLKLTARGEESPAEIEQQAIALVSQRCSTQKFELAPIVELRIDGEIGFERSEVDARRLQQQLQTQSGALIFLLKFEAEVPQYATPLAAEASRVQIEQDVFADVLASNAVYKKRAVELAHGLIELKDRQQRDQPEDELYRFVQDLLLAQENQPNE